MKKIRLTEKDLQRIVKRTIKEQEDDYSVFKKSSQPPLFGDKYSEELRDYDVHQKDDYMDDLGMKIGDLFEEYVDKKDGLSPEDFIEVLESYVNAIEEGIELGDFEHIQ